MVELPPPLRAIHENLGGADFPAYLVIKSTGEIVSWGGDCKRYGLFSLVAGRLAVEQIPILDGLLGGEDLFNLQSLQIENACFFDLYVLKQDNQFWVLLVDATETTQAKQKSQQALYDQILSKKESGSETRMHSCFTAEAFEGGLFEGFSNMEGVELDDVLPVLNLAWFERQNDGAFKMCGPAPDWVVLLYPEALDSQEVLQPGDKFLFLDNFLHDATGFWGAGQSDARLKSGLWQETDMRGDRFLLEATALRVGGRSVLLIECVEDEDRRELIQTAREKQLAYLREIQTQTKAVKTLSNEKDLAQAASQAKSDFLASMSHEIRTPMNSILGFAQILQTATNLTEKQKRYLETIENSGHHLMSLINDILDLAKIESGKEELYTQGFDLHTLAIELGDMFRLRCDENHLQWRLHVPSQQIWVHGDERKLRQVLINLLGNAVKFTDSGAVELFVEPMGEDRFRFEVRDTGQGIPADKQAGIFEPFKQEDEGHKKGGTGLGLAISRHLVDLMGGELELLSTLGEGTRFFFTLSLVPEPPKEPLTPTAHLNKRLAPDQTIRAVVADDGAENREVLGTMLDFLGVEAVVVENGKEALDAMEVSLPDIVFLDIHMPKMDGVTTMLNIWKKFGKDAVRIVAVSASVLVQERRRYLAAGFDAFLDKPILGEHLCDCLENLMGVTFVDKDASQN